MSLNVLVADDSAVARAMIVKCLRLAGLPLGELHEAANGQEGLAALDEHWTDLVLVDINMPVMDGEEMIEKMRSSPDLRVLPVVVISTEGSETRIERLEEKGVSFVHKPFTPETIREVVERITGISRERKWLHEMLSQVAADVFEELAFMLSMSEEEGEDTHAPLSVAAGISFEGPFPGVLIASVSESILPALASNMLGLDDEAEPQPDQQQDALKELVNVVCGNLLPAIAGPKVVFKVHAPEIIGEGSGVAPPKGALPTSVARVTLHEGRAEFKLFVEGELPGSAPVRELVESGRRDGAEAGHVG